MKLALSHQGCLNKLLGTIWQFQVLHRFSVPASPFSRWLANGVWLDHQQPPDSALSLPCTDFVVVLLSHWHFYADRACFTLI